MLGAGRGNKAVFARGVVCALTLALLVVPLCAWATMVPSDDWLRPEWLRDDDSLSYIANLFDVPQVYDGRSLAGQGDVDDSLVRLILDESWSEWLAFQRLPYRVIPLEALKRILRVDYVHTKLEQSSGPEPGEMLEAAGNILLPGQAAWVPSKEGLVSHGGGGSRKFSPFEWLIQEEGLFSGRPWDWENFLPRIFTIGGLVVLGLLVTEGLHYLFGLGARVMGMRERHDGAETP